MRGLTKDFDTVRVVDDVSFAVPSGTVTGFIGGNGSGKTTTIRMLCGLITPTCGEGLLNGLTYGRLPEPRRSVGVVADRLGAHPGHTARRHLSLSAWAGGFDVAQVDEALAEVGLTDAANVKLGRYSMGMRQRCALAVALLGRPPVLLLDEPANGLDPAGIRWLRGLIRGWADDGGTVLVSTHQLAELALVVDQVVVLDRGRLAYCGSVDELVADSSRSLEDAVVGLVDGEGVQA